MPVAQLITTAGRGIINTVPAGSYVWNGTSSTHGYAGGDSYPRQVSSYRYPDNSTGNVLYFNGTGWAESNSLGTFNQFYLDFWFRPSSTNVAIFTETTFGGAENSGYHYNMIEINANGTVSAGIWINPIAYVTSDNTVTTGAWNHIYFYYDAGSIRLELNGSQVTATGITPERPGANSYFGIGMNEITHISTSNRYYGYIDTWYGGTTIQSSRYASTKATYGY